MAFHLEVLLCFSVIYGSVAAASGEVTGINDAFDLSLKERLMIEYMRNVETYGVQNIDDGWYKGTCHSDWDQNEWDSLLWVKKGKVWYEVFHKGTLDDISDAEARDIHNSINKMFDDLKTTGHRNEEVGSKPIFSSIGWARLNVRVSRDKRFLHSWGHYSLLTDYVSIACKYSVEDVSK